MAGLVGALMAPLILMAIELAQTRGWGLLNATVWPAPIAVIAGILLFNLWMYVWHRANHEDPLLWRLHRVHHTDPRMDSTTAFRFHPGEIAVSALLNAVVILYRRSPMPETRPVRLLFVYNADSGLFNAMADIGHKLFSPETYACRLCAITYGLLTEKAKWRAFVSSIDAECEFLHRDELHRREPGLSANLPAVFRITDQGPKVCLDAVTLNGCSNIADLKALIRSRCLEESKFG